MPFSDNPINVAFRKREIRKLTVKIDERFNKEDVIRVLKSFDYLMRARHILALEQAGVITRIGKPSDPADLTVHFWENEYSRQLPALDLRLRMASSLKEFEELRKLRDAVGKKAWAPEADL